MQLRNEGCSIADWLMLNLNAGLITGEDGAYEKAERIFWNALAFNQWINGSFGHRGSDGQRLRPEPLRGGMVVLRHNAGWR